MAPTKKTTSPAKKTRPLASRSSSAQTKKKYIEKKSKDFKFRFNTSTQIAELILDVENSKLNVLKTNVLHQLNEHLDYAQQLPVKLLWFKSGKKGNFIAGADISEIAEIANEKEGEALVRQGQQILQKLATFKAPTVAVIDGHALGGGLELALACTYRVVTSESHTRLGLPEVTLGILPGFGGTQRLPLLVGLPTALKMILRGSAVNGKRAYQTGLADKLIPSAYLAFELPKLATEILDHPQTLRRSRLKRKSRRSPFLVNLLIRLGKRTLIGYFRKQILKTTGAHYPAPLKVLEIIRKTYPANSPAKIREGLGHESRAFAWLCQQESTGHLINLFQHSTAVKKQELIKPAPFQPRKKIARSIPRRTLKKQHFPIRQSWVIGSGTMGSGIAWFLSHSGLPTRIKETSWQFAEKGYRNLQSLHKQRERKANQSRSLTKSELARVSFTTKWNPLHNETLVIEAAPEEMALKKKIFQTLETYSQPDTILATNTSSLSLTEIAHSLKHPERFLAIHFFNPVHRMRLVEISAVPQTDPLLFTTVANFLRKNGKIVIPVKACPGFLVNRILFAYLSEALRLLEETKDLIAIDKSLTDFGMPMGPFALMDQIGIDVCAHVGYHLSKGNSQQLHTLPIYEKLQAKKWLGKKGDIGFYLYDKGKPIGVNPTLYLELYGESATMKRTFKPEEFVERLILALACEALISLETEIVRTPWELDLAMIYGTGFPAFRGGILRYLDTLTPGKTLKKLERLKNFHGKQFTPPQLLQNKVRLNQRFYKT